jgi:hypothetical protein
MRRVRRTQVGHIDLKNTTSLSERLIRKMIREAARSWSHHLEIPGDWTLSLKRATFRNRDYSYSGIAYLARGRFVCSLGENLQKDVWAVIDDRKKWAASRGTSHILRELSARRMRSFRQIFNVVIHEVGHMAVWWKEEFRLAKRSRRHGKGSGGDEEYICRLTNKFLDRYKDQELREWVVSLS